MEKACLRVRSAPRKAELRAYSQMRALAPTTNGMNSTLVFSGPININLFYLKTRNAILTEINV